MGAEPAALHHRRPADADVRVLRGDHDVTAAQEDRVAGKAAAGGDGDERHEAAEAGEEVKRPLSAPVLHKRAGVEEILDVLSRGLPSAAPAAGHRVGPAGVQTDRVPFHHGGEVGTDGVERRAVLVVRDGRARLGWLECEQFLAGVDRLPDGYRDRGDRPLVSAATMCCIFMDSSTASCCPGRTTLLGATSIDTTVACMGATTVSGTADRSMRRF